MSALVLDKNRVIFFEKRERVTDLLRRLSEDFVLEPVRLGKIGLALLHLDSDQQVVKPNDVVRKLKLADLLDLKLVRRKREFRKEDSPCDSSDALLEAHNRSNGCYSILARAE